MNKRNEPQHKNNPHGIEQTLVGGPFDGRSYNLGKYTYSPVVEIGWHKQDGDDEILMYEIQPDMVTRKFIGSRPYRRIITLGLN